jgi:hypothetical protein
MEEGSDPFILILILVHLGVPILGTTSCCDGISCCICFLHDELLLLILVRYLSTHEEYILCALAVFLLRTQPHQNYDTLMIYADRQSRGKDAK